VQFHSGKSGTATVNGNEVPLIDWSANSSAEIVKFINSKTSNYPLREATFRDFSGSFGIDFDFDNNPFGSPLSITAGTTLTNVKLFLNGTAGIYWGCASAVVSDTPQQLSVEGKIVTRINFVTSGTVTAPGGATP